MTAIDTTLRATGFAFAPRITRLIETVSTNARKAAERRTTRRALEALTDVALDDIGLTRAEIYTRF